jgi:hypothetical protein
MPAEELYNLKADPREIHNLAAVLEQDAPLKRMRGVLEKWIEDSNDQGRIPEPPGTETGSNKAAKKRKGSAK